MATGIKAIPRLPNSPNWIATVRCIDFLMSNHLKPFYSDVPRSAPQVRYAPQKYYPLRGVLDLGGRYALSDIYYYDANGVDSFYIYYGEPDHWFLLLATTTDYYNKWVHLQVHIQTRYLYFILTGQQSVVKEILLYGNLIGKRLSSRP